MIASLPGLHHLVELQPLFNGMVEFDIPSGRDVIVHVSSLYLRCERLPFINK